MPKSRYDAAFAALLSAAGVVLAAAGSADGTGVMAGTGVPLATISADRPSAPPDRGAIDPTPARGNPAPPGTAATADTSVPADASVSADSPSGAAPARASRPAPSSRQIEELAGHVPLIVVAVCSDIRSDWNSAHTLITTTATYSVERTVKDERTGGGLARADRAVTEVAGGGLTVRQIGGTVGRITQALIGGPEFRLGERSLLFLTPDAAGDLRVYGLALGKQLVYRDPRSGIDRVRLGGGAETALHGSRDLRTAAGSSIANGPAHSNSLPSVPLTDSKTSPAAAPLAAGSPTVGDRNPVSDPAGNDTRASRGPRSSRSEPEVGDSDGRTPSAPTDLPLDALIQSILRAAGR